LTIMYCNVAAFAGAAEQATTKLVAAVLVETPQAVAVALAPTLTEINELAPTLAASAVIVKDVAAPSGTHPEASSAKLPTVTFVRAVPEPIATEVAVATPKTGAVIVGEVKVLLVNVSVPAKVAKVPVVGKVSPVTPETVNVVAKFPEIVSVEAALFAIPVPPLAAPKIPVTPVVKGSPVALVNTRAEGVPRAGVTNTGDVAVITPVTTTPPEPAWMVVVEVVFVEPITIVLTAAPVPMLIVLAVTPLPIVIPPVLATPIAIVPPVTLSNNVFAADVPPLIATTPVPEAFPSVRVPVVNAPPIAIVDVVELLNKVFAPPVIPP